MSTPLTLHIEHDAEGRLVVRAIGEVDASNVTDLAKALAHGLNDGGPLTVDFSAVEYLDSAGINALVRHAESLHIIANPILMRVLRVSGLGDLATISPGASVTLVSGLVVRGGNGSHGTPAFVSASRREIARRYFLR